MRATVRAHLTVIYGFALNEKNNNNRADWYHSVMLQFCDGAIL
jgi:hypothetical protein